MLRHASQAAMESCDHKSGTDGIMPRQIMIFSVDSQQRTNEQKGEPAAQLHGTRVEPTIRHFVLASMTQVSALMAYQH